MSHLIAPSLLASDFTKLGETADMLNNSQADWYHLDVMDGMFVPNISFGLPVISALRPLSKKVFDVHLMIEKPERYISDFKKAGADILTVHYEASTHLHRTIHAIQDEGMKAGVALNPHTPVTLLYDVLDDIDLVCLMGVNPGFGGQSFIKNTYYKVEQLRMMIDESDLDVKIEIDGGVNSENASKLLEYGADVLVAGSFVFRSDNPTETIKQLKEIER
ncbi:MAG: ribulose-phosphate 3-epimerase [Cryomorphaceae bacterium]|nr:ribulose-phosphate 3-epimerase [Cryomorphaceae bacterium]